MKYKKPNELKKGDKVIQVYLDNIIILKVDYIDIHPAGRMMNVGLSNGYVIEEVSTVTEGYIELNSKLFGIMKYYIDENYFREHYENMFNSMKKIFK